MSMELWVAVILMFGGPDKSSPMIHTMSGPPVETVELCERDAKSQGLKIYYRMCTRRHVRRRNALTCYCW